MTEERKGVRPFTSEDLTTATSPVVKRRRRVGKENTVPYYPVGNGLCFNPLVNSAPLPLMASTNASGSRMNTSSSNNSQHSFRNCDRVIVHENSKKRQCQPQRQFTTFGKTGNIVAGLPVVPNIVLKSPLSNKKKINKVQGGRRLFNGSEMETATSAVDYENTEFSEIAGFSDSDSDTETSDAADDTYNTESGTSHVNNETVGHNSETVEETWNSETVEDTWARDKIKDVPKEYKSLGAPDCVCDKCGAQMWKHERTNKKVTKGKPKFSICCSKGRVKLPAAKPTPPFLKQLYDDKVKGPSFRRCVRIYNSMFAFTSMGGNVDNTINRGGQPYVYRLNGQNHHQFGSLLPKDGDDPRFCQLYIYDTENEIGNRMRWINVNDTNKVDPEIVEGLLKMLDETNELVKCFRMARDRFQEDHIVDLKIVLKVSRSESGRENHVTPSDEVAAVMIGDLEETCGRRDVIIDSKIDGLKRISDIHPKLMALQYPLLFPYGEDGYHEKIYYIRQENETELKRKFVSMREYYSYMLQIRRDGGNQ